MENHRPVLKKKLIKHDRNTNLDRIIGKRVRMLTQADFDNLGSAKVGDIVWSVKAQENDGVLPANEIVEIISVDGNKLIARLCD